MTKFPMTERGTMHTEGDPAVGTHKLVWQVPGMRGVDQPGESSAVPELHTARNLSPNETLNTHILKVTWRKETQHVLPQGRCENIALQTANISESNISRGRLL